MRKAYRVAHGQYLYRVETTSPGTMVAGRAMQWVTADRDTVTGFALQGFGISDLLLAGAAQPNKPSPKRWSDFNASPIFDALRTNGTLDIIWENYDLGVRGGQSVYSVAITIQRQRSAAGNIAAAVVGVAASALGIDRRSDRVTMTVERVVPATPGALADHIAIAMNDTPSGDYLLTLEITDKVRGRKVSALAPLVIAQ